MEVKHKKEITYSVDDIKALIEEHICLSGLSPGNETYKMELLVEEESVFTNNTDGWIDYKFVGIKVTVESKE